MTEWNPKTENLIRDLGDYLDVQMRDLLNPKASVAGSMLRIVFRAAATGKPLKHRMKEAGLAAKDWKKGVQTMIDLAEQNSSNAAVQLKKSFLLLNQIESDFTGVRSNPFKQVRNLKNKGYSY